MISGPEKATSSMNLFQDKMESEITNRSPADDCGRISGHKCRPAHEGDDRYIADYRDDEVMFTFFN